MASADKNLSQKMMQVSCRWQMDGVLNRCSKTLLANLQITFIMFLTSSRRISTPFPSNPTEFPCCMTNFGFISIMVYFSRSPRWRLQSGSPVWRVFRLYGDIELFWWNSKPCLLDSSFRHIIHQAIGPRVEEELYKIHMHSTYNRRDWELKWQCLIGFT